MRHNIYFRKLRDLRLLGARHPRPESEEQCKAERRVKACDESAVGILKKRMSGFHKCKKLAIRKGAISR
jgi:hypothetical protein